MKRAEQNGVIYLDWDLEWYEEEDERYEDYPDCNCAEDGTRPCSNWPECGGPMEV